MLRVQSTTANIIKQRVKRVFNASNFGDVGPHCQACHSPLTVKHVLIDCTCFSAAYQRYLGLDTLEEVFENVAHRNIIAFVKDINLCSCT